MKTQQRTNETGALKYQLVYRVEKSKPMFSDPQKTITCFETFYRSFAHRQELLDHIKNNKSKPGFRIMNIKKLKPGKRVGHPTYQNLSHRESNNLLTFGLQ